MDLSFLLEQAAILKANLDKMRPLDAEREAMILQKLRLDWNYHSNHLEGGKLTYGETKALILFGITASGKPLQDHLETSGHNEAIKWIEDMVKGERPLTESFIRELHELILKEPYKKPAITPNGGKVERWISIGRYKTSPNHVQTQTGETFRFASPEETPARMTDLMDWYAQKKANAATNAILFAAEFHYKFILIHPFDDGNGRIARLLMNFILMQYGYPPAIIKTDDKDNYFAALQQADAGILEPFVGYITENVMKTLDIMLRGAKGENIEEPDDLDKKLRLLDNQLQSAGDKIEKLTEKVLAEWVEQVFSIIANKFIAMNAKFEKYYVDTKYKFNLFTPEEWLYRKYEIEKEEREEYGSDVDEYGEFYRYEIKNLRQKGMNIAIVDLFKERMNDDNIDRILESKYPVNYPLSCHFTTFNRTEIPPFDYTSTLNIKFSKSEYYLIGDASKIEISKLYHQIPTDEELNYLLAKEADCHLAFIHKKLAPPK